MASVTGLAAIDDCVGIGACPLNCGDPACDENAYRCAYPNFPECTGAPDCDLIPSVPRGRGCGTNPLFESPCITGQFVSRLWECGPCDGQFSTAGYCNSGQNLQIISCITSVQFQDMCNGCNPFTWGLIKVTIFP